MQFLAVYACHSSLSTSVRDRVFELITEDVGGSISVDGSDVCCATAVMVLARVQQVVPVRV